MRLKRLVADLSLDKEMLQEVLRKIALKPDQKRQSVDDLRLGYQASTRRACQMVELPRSTIYYRSRKDEQAFLMKRIREIAATLRVNDSG